MTSPFSAKNDDIFELIENDIAKFSSDGHILLFGDFNAKTNTDPDYIIDNSPDNSLLDTGPLFNIDLSDNITKFDRSHNNHTSDTY